MACAVVESGWICACCDPGGHAGDCCILVARRFPVGSSRGQYQGGNCGHSVHGFVSRIFCAELLGAARFSGSRTDLLGFDSVFRGEAARHRILVLPGSASEGNGRACADGTGHMGVAGTGATETWQSGCILELAAH